MDVDNDEEKDYCEPQTLSTINSIGMVLDKQANYKEARNWFLRAFRGQKKVLGDEQDSQRILQQRRVHQGGGYIPRGT